MRFTDLAGWLAWQQTLHPSAIELGLERVRRVLEALSLDPPPYACAVIGGTNGKGSCVAVLDALARAAGSITGAYTSPHLRRYNERVRVDGRMASDDELVAAFDVVDRARGQVSLTYFEFGTLAALEVFRRRGVELAVLEVGLGGRLDAVNVVDGAVAVVTSIGLDHQEWLGPDRERIGAEKGGIFRPGTPAVIGDREPPASLLALAGTDALRIGRDFDRAGTGNGWAWRLGDDWLENLPAGPLAAPALLDNAACALTAWSCLSGGPPADGLVRRALSELELEGRLQRIDGEVEWWLDVAHNPGGAAVLAGALAASPAGGRTLAVAGFMTDKDVAGIAAAMAAAVDEWVAAGLPPPRGLAGVELASRLAAVVDVPVHAAADVAAACTLARRRARRGDRIVVFGSFRAVGPALDWLGVYSGAPAA